MLQVLEKKLYNFKPQTNEEYFVHIACQEAFSAISQGNFGIGAVLVDQNHNIVIKGHNQVFNPYFRSDLHAEMVVMNSFEESYKGDKQNLKEYTLYTSLEPCPMCLSRLITSGVGTVVFAYDDTEGGMVSRIAQLPPVWKHLSSFQNFRRANISEDLKNLAKDIFLFNVSQLDKELEV